MVLDVNLTGDDAESGSKIVSATVGHMLGIAINRLRGRVSLFEPEFTNDQIADALETAGTQRGLFDLDELHHAPACRANRWSGRCLPTGPCTCGAKRAAMIAEQREVK